MAADDGARQTAETAKASTRKATKVARSTADKVTKTAKETTRKAAATAKATRAARSGRVVKAKHIATEADLEEGVATRAIEGADDLHYQVEVNKRGMSVKGLTKTLNERWDNGWRLAHVLEQRGNTVLVFEKRS